MNEQISNKLFELNSFKKQYSYVLKMSVIRQFKHEIIVTNKIDWNNLLTISSIFSKSNTAAHMDAALRISQVILNTLDTNDAQKKSAILILKNLTNERAIELAIDKQLINKSKINDIPYILQLENIQNSINHTIIINNKLLFLNRFQIAVIDAFSEKQFISISSPTSSGKSFILMQMLLKMVENKQSMIIYIVPTRALINQVENDIRNLIRKEDIQNIFISTVPKMPDEDFNHKIYVLTQERLHWFFSEYDLIIDLLIVDEAQQIGQNYRGILLNEKIIETLEENQNTKIVFASPFTKNPEILFSDLSEKQKIESIPIMQNYIAVNQNLLFISSDKGTTKKWKVDLVEENNSETLFKIEFDESIKEANRLTKIVKELSNSEGGNLIYQYQPSYAENEAFKLYQILDDTEVSKPIQELIKLVKDTIHPKYKLVKVLEKSIAFHYGNIPLLIRQEIERLFTIGEIKYIFCTSTLLEGINLPAKNIFLRKPKRAPKIEMSQTDFWNLAGRAGRLGKEFQGNIICVDVHKWNEIPSLQEKKSYIKKSLDTLNNERNEEFMKFIINQAPREKLDQNLLYEYGFNYYYSRWLENKLDTVVKNEIQIKKLNELFTKIEIDIPVSIVKKHAGISPIAQQELLSFFLSKKDIKNYIPYDIHSDDAIDSYKKIVDIVNEYLSGGPLGAINYHLSKLVIYWMRGYKLSFLIKNSIQYWKKNDSSKKRDTIIRDVMRDVEEFARFKFSKYSSCYIDILRLALKEKKEEKLMESIPDISMWLEFGVSETTQLSFIELGLSRNTAIELSEYAPSTEMSRLECQNWLKKQDLESFELSNILIKEIKNRL